jgi:hypothetical protein
MRLCFVRTHENKSGYQPQPALLRFRSRASVRVYGLTSVKDAIPTKAPATSLSGFNPIAIASSRSTLAAEWMRSGPRYFVAQLRSSYGLRPRRINSAQGWRIVSPRTDSASCRFEPSSLLCEFRLRISTAIRAASRRRLGIAAFRPASLSRRVRAAVMPAARCFRVREAKNVASDFARVLAARSLSLRVSTALPAASRRRLVRAAFTPAALPPTATR